jgi:hypothetical protein
VPTTFTITVYAAELGSAEAAPITCSTMPMPNAGWMLF